MRLAVAAMLLAACGDSFDSGPFDALPLEAQLTFELGAPVHVARDEYGIAHLFAQRVDDIAFAQGYVMAHDRLPQMDILRRFGAGTLAELYGLADPAVIDTDLEMRMHRMTHYATLTWAQLQSSTDPTDRELVTLLQRFADGVNAYASDLVAGKWTLDRDVEIAFALERFAPWTPIDSLVLGRFQAFALSWTVPVELDLTELETRLRATFHAGAGDPERAARAGVERDVLMFTPVGTTSTIPDFPAGDTSALGGDCPAPGRTTATVRATPPARRPDLPAATLSRARDFFARGVNTGAFGALGPHAFMNPHAGSNSWAVRPNDRIAVLATDQHLQLANPSIFYPTHLRVENERQQVELDVIGVTFPGIPGVILGTNGEVAWSATVSNHDVNDIYAEKIVLGGLACVPGGVPCALGAPCACVGDQPRRLDTFTETVTVGAFGVRDHDVTATYEVVPHHGPIIPAIDRAQHRLVPRADEHALSVRYTGYQPTFELRALWKLAHAGAVADALPAFTDFTYGSQNWTLIDGNGGIGWTTASQVPRRAPAAYAWNATANPDGAAPFFVLPGDGSAEWEGTVSPCFLPHALDGDKPIITANADPVQATFDGDPLDQRVEDGVPLYVGVAYAAGLRQDRIARLIATGEAGSPPDSTLDSTIERTAAIQHDTQSTVGAHLRPHVVKLLPDPAQPGTLPADAEAYLAGLADADRAAIATGCGLVQAWSLATPTAIDGHDPDSAATCVFNTWMHFFLEGVLADELAAAGFATPAGAGDVWRLDDNALARIANALLSRPGERIGNGQPILCDRLGTPTVESCSRVATEAMLATMNHLASPTAFGTTDTAAWRWGKLHHLTLAPLFPNKMLTLGPFPKRGDNFAVNRADPGWSDLDFAQSADGPAQRMIVTPSPLGLALHWALPGGVVFDPRDRHYRDLLDNYYLTEQHFQAPFRQAQIVSHGEHRWELR